MKNRYYVIRAGRLVPVFTPSLQVFVAATDLEKLRKLSMTSLDKIGRDLSARLDGKDFVLSSLGHGESGDFVLGTADLNGIEVPDIEIPPILTKHRVRGKKNEKG